MRYSVDRVAIQAALQQDDTRSYRSIADEFGVSDWTVRSIARQFEQRSEADEALARGAAFCT